MIKKVTEKEPEDLTHKGAQTVLHVMPLQHPFAEMTETEIVAIMHYEGCEVCSSIGLSRIRKGKPDLTCQEALLIWASKPGPLYLRASMETLNELLAVEHVWGQGLNRLGGCDKEPCTTLRHYWENVPFSMFNDAPESIVNLFPFLINIFIKQKWPLDRLFDIQSERVFGLLKNIETGKITLSLGSYRHISELKDEVRAHVLALQNLILKAQGNS